MGQLSFEGTFDVLTDQLINAEQAGVFPVVTELRHELDDHATSDPDAYLRMLYSRSSRLGALTTNGPEIIA